MTPKSDIFPKTVKKVTFGGKIDRFANITVPPPPPPLVGQVIHVVSFLGFDQKHVSPLSPFLQFVLKVPPKSVSITLPIEVSITPQSQYQVHDPKSTTFRHFSLTMTRHKGKSDQKLKIWGSND